MKLEEHNEKLCHQVGELRAGQLKEVVQLLQEYKDEVDCLIKDKKALVKSGQPKRTDFFAIRLPDWKGTPLITSASVQEVRKTCAKYNPDEERPGLKVIWIPGENPHSMPPWKSRTKSLEIRGGRVFVGCECVKYNGLQDKCMRVGCDGGPDCMNRPYPACGPARVYPRSRLYEEPTTRSTQTEEPCCKCVLRGPFYRAPDCTCPCHNT